MQPKLDVLLASIIYLMTRYARKPSVELARAINEHLQLLEQHPDCKSDVLHKAGARLKRQWASLLASSSSKSANHTTTKTVEPLLH